MPSSLTPATVVGERADPSPYQLQLSGKWLLHLSWQHSRTDPIGESENVSVGDLAPPLTCHVVVWAGDRAGPEVG